MTSRDLEDLVGGLLEGEFIHRLDILTLKSTRPGGKTKVPKGLTELMNRVTLALSELLEEQMSGLTSFRAELSSAEGRDTALMSRVYAAMYVFDMQRLEALRLVEFMSDQYKRNMKRTAKESAVMNGSKLEYDIGPGLEEVTEEVFLALRGHAYLTTANAEVQQVKKDCVVKLAAASMSMKNDTALAEAWLTARARKVGIHGDDANHYSRRFYMKCAAGVILLLWSLSECHNNETMGRHIWNDPTFSIFMCVGDILLMVWMFGASIIAWDKAGVDFLGLLQMEDSGLGKRFTTPAAPVLNTAANMTLVYLAAFIAFNKALRGVFSDDENLPLAHAFPTLLVIYVAYEILGKKRVRRLLYEYLGRVLIAPFSDVIFRDSYVGDLLTSLVRVNLQLAFAVGYSFLSVFAWFENDMALASSAAPHKLWKHSFVYQEILVPLLTLLPLWLRFVQCLRRSVETGQRWPHLCNALKYCSAMSVISFSVFNEDTRQYWLWIVAFTGATLFQYWWDIFQDWGLLVPANDPLLASSLRIPGTDLVLRTPRLMGSVPLYMLVASSNLVLRFAWALTLLDIPNPSDQDEHEQRREGAGGEDEGNVGAYLEKVDDRPSLLVHLFPIMAALEVFRRMVWCVLRVEWEQIEVQRKQGQLKELKSVMDRSSSSMSNSGIGAKLSSSIEYMSEDDDDEGDDEEQGLMRDGRGMRRMEIESMTPTWARVPNLGIANQLFDTVAWVQAQAGAVTVLLIDWEPREDWWLQTFPRFMVWLYASRLFTAIVDPAMAHVAAPRLVESVLLAAAMLAVMLCAFIVDI